MEREDDESDYRTKEELEWEAKARKNISSRPPPFQLLKWQEHNRKQVIRKVVYENLRSYEAKRRTTFSAKLEATQLYFSSLMELLESSFVETAKVFRLALGTAMAQSQYARAITQRGSHQAPRDSSPSSELLHKWQEGNTLLAATLEESAVTIEKNIVSTISGFQDALQDQKNQFDNVGKPILHELEFMEDQVQRMWDAYWKTASKTMDTPAGSVALPFFHPDATSSALASGQEDHAPTQDLWTLEMQYQMAVALQRATWEKRGPEIVRLATSSREMEVTRRIKLNECMVMFLQCLQKLFKTIGEEDARLPDPNAALNPLNLLQQEIEKSVHEQVEAALPGDISLSDDNSDDYCILEANGLVMTTKVLEWKNTESPLSAADRWKTALAVITVDKYLHLFDMTPFCNDPEIFPGCDPNVAMEHLFPFSRHGRSGEEKAKPIMTIRDKMVPEKTILLTKHCSFQFLNGECCEITQKSSSGTASLLLGKKQKPSYKAQIRILDSHPGSSDRLSFFAILRHQ